MLAERPELARRIADGGHELGSHSWDHSHFDGRHARAWTQLMRTWLAIRRVAGSAPRWHRPPYADWTPGLGRIAAIAGMGTVTWDVDPRDWEVRDAGVVARRVLAEVLPGSVVLLHDSGAGIAARALPDILTGLRERGLTALTVSELLAAT